MKSFSFFTGEQPTPKSVKWIIWITVVVSLLTPLSTYWFQYFHLSGPLAWLPLSRFGIQQGWFWQPATYFFLHSAESSLSLSSLIGLFFNMLLLWFTGSELALRYGNYYFLLAYLGAGLIAGLASLLFLVSFPSAALLVGSAPAIFSLIMLWAMLYPELELSFFFVIKIKAKWLAAIYLGVALLMSLSSEALIISCAEMVGIIWGFCIGHLLWKLPNPYPLNLDFSRSKKNRQQPQDKIIDISALQENDDAFMDRMLDKIAREGKEKLTNRERERMKKISERKSR